MTGQRSSSVYDVLDSPAKRNKGNDGRWRQPGWRPANTSIISPAHQTGAHDTIISDNQQQAYGSDAPSSTPSRSQTYFDLIRDALTANPDGMSSNDVFGWLRDNRPVLFGQYDEKKLRAGVNGTLSAQSNKQPPTVWKYKADGSEGLGYIWRLASSEPTAEPAPACEDIQTPTSPARDASTRDLRRGQVGITIPTTTPNRSCVGGAVIHTVSNGDAAVDNDHETQNVESDTYNGLRDSRGARATSEPSRTSKSKSPTSGRSEYRAQSQQEQETIVAQASVTASAPEGIRRNSDSSEHSRDSDHENQLRYGKLVSKIQKILGKHERLMRKIDAKRSILPDIKALQEDVEQTARKVEELTRLLEGANRSAEFARNSLKAATIQTREIQTDEMKAEQLVADTEGLRSQLGIDYHHTARDGHLLSIRTPSGRSIDE